MFNLFKKRKGTGVILMYHRINTAVSDTWQLCVSPEIFEEQMKVLKNFHVISMRQLVKDINSNNIQPHSVAITFDDGYLDNYINAKSILEKHRYPATFFITNASQQTNIEYWWDQLEHLLLENIHLPGEIKITLRGASYSWSLNDSWKKIISEEEMKDFASWLPWQTPPSTQHALFIYLSEWIKALSYTEQLNVLEQLQHQCGKEFHVRDEYRIMNTEQLKQLSNGESFEIGGHSAWHTALGKFNADVQYNAIHENKNYLESVTGKGVSGYCYAHGSYNETSLRLLKDASFSYACTTEEAVVSENSNIFALPRFQVKNVKSNLFEKQLEKWFKM